MAWNEPGGGKDPWGGNSGGDGPPDLDEALQKLRARMDKIFGGSGGGKGGSGNNNLLAIVLVTGCCCCCCACSVVPRVRACVPVPVPLPCVRASCRGCVG
mgnify:CR=1 FL=1